MTEERRQLIEFLAAAARRMVKMGWPPDRQAYLGLRYAVRRLEPPVGETMLRSISEFSPPGMQISSPGDLMIDPKRIIGIEASGRYHIVTIHYGGGDKTTIEFYPNTDGDGVALMCNIRDAANEPGDLPAERRRLIEDMAAAARHMVQHPDLTSLDWLRRAVRAHDKRD